MKFLLRLISNRHFLPLLIVFVFTVLAGRTLIFQSGYFNMHDDLQMMRQLQMEKCFLDGQIPCRWVPDMGYGYGFPLFNFYPPLPYLIGQGIRLLGFSFVTTVKLNFALSILVSGIAMYLLSREFFGSIGGVLSAVFYIWAPYRAVDIFVRGAMNESWALVWFPLIFYFSYKLITGKKTQIKRNVIFLSLSYFALLTSHNLMVLIFTPFLGVWVLIHLWSKNIWNRILHLIISGIWALGLSAFFTLPALVENKFTWIRSQLTGYFDYKAHFVDLNQLFISRFWGYDGSAWGIENDGMSFSIGYLHWILSLVVALILLVWVVRKISFCLGFKGQVGIMKKVRKDHLLLATSFMLFVGWFSAFLTHSRSTLIWQVLPQLSYVQFPWRFLTITIFAFSFVVGYLPVAFHSKRRFFDFAFAPLRMTITSVLIIILVIVNWNYFRPKGGKMGPLTDQEKFSEAAWILQQKAGIMDYLPKTARMEPTAPRMEIAEIMEGEGKIEGAEEGTYWVKFNAKIDSKAAKVRINIFDFPGWRVFSKNTELEKYISKNENWGRIWINLSSGDHLIYAQFFNTPVRTYSNLISVVSWVGLFSYPFWKKKSG
jgi:hypothetical protein